MFVSARGPKGYALTGRANHGRDVYVEWDLQWIGNHRLSGRCRIAKAQKGSPAALRCAVHASRKPGVAIELRFPCYAQARGVLPCTPVRHICRTPGYPSNACVRPMDGFTAAREMLIPPGPTEGFIILLSL
jgi:hypothetical protein